MPNIFVLVLDDYRAAPDGSGTRLIENCPNLLDFFETDGTLFPNYFCTTPICAPSRATMYSSRYAEQHGIQINEDARDKEFLDWYSMTRIFQQAGYDTGLMHKYLWTSRYDPYNPGLDPNPAPRPNWFEHRYQAGPTRDEAEHDVALAEKFLAPHLEGTDTRPWFFMFCTSIPHGNYGADPVDAYTPLTWTAPDSNTGETAPQLAKKAPQNRGNGAPELQDTAEEYWLGMDQEMNALDQQWPKVTGLFTTDQLDETIFVMVTDNGFQLGEHAGLLSKQYPYVESCQLSAWIHAVDLGVGAGVTETKLSANIDIAPTLLEAADLTDLYPYAEGLDMLGATDRDILYTSLPAGASGQRHVGTWRAAVIPDGSGNPERHYIETLQSNGTTWTEDYDLVADPGEMDASNTVDSEMVDALDEIEATLELDAFPSTGSEANVCL